MPSRRHAARPDHAVPRRAGLPHQSPTSSGTPSTRRICSRCSELGQHLHAPDEPDAPTCWRSASRCSKARPSWAAWAWPPAPAAVFYSIINLAQAGDNIVSARNLYGGTYTQFNDILPALGITVKFVDSNDPQNFAKAIDAKTRALFCETVSNPALEVTDLEAVAKIAHAHGLPLIVDSTFSTPYLTQPLEHGADIVVHSLTKWFGGHGTGIGGVVVDSGRFNWAAGKHPLYDDAGQQSYHGLRWGHRPARPARAAGVHPAHAHRCRCATSAPASRRTTPGCSCRASRPCRCAWSAIARTRWPWRKHLQDAPAGRVGALPRPAGRPACSS